MSQSLNIISYKEVNAIVSNPDLYMTTLEAVKEFIKADVDNISQGYTGEVFKTTKIDAGSALTMLYLLKPVVDLYELLGFERDDILDSYKDTGSYAKYFDRLLERAYEKLDTRPDIDRKETLKRLQEGIFFAINELSIFSSEYILFLKSPTISIYDILSTAKKNPEMRELMNFSHDTYTTHLSNMQDKITEQDKVSKRVIDYIMEDDASQLATLIKSGGGVNLNQLAEVIVTIGYKPDIQGRVVSTPLNTSFFKGIDNLVDAYTNALGGRKANITSKMQVKSSGYLNRKTGVVTEDIRIDTTIEPCKSKRHLEIEIKTKDHLNLFIDRYYTYDGLDGYKLLTKHDTHLVGSKIKLKSPITCGCRDKDSRVCRECYGALYRVNEGLNVGTIATLIFTEPMSQGLLSAKHRATSSMI